MPTAFEEALTSALSAEASGVRLDRDLLEPALRRTRRRTAVRRAGAAAVTLGAAGAVAAVVLPSAGRAPAPTVDVVNAAYVTQRAAAAVSAGNQVEHVRGRGALGTTDVWYDEGTGSWRMVAGATEKGATPAGSTTVLTTLNDRERTWSRASVTGLAPAGAAGDKVPGTPAQLAAALRGGNGWTVVGRERVNGVSTVHIRRPGDDVWVDASTYRPVHEVMTGADAFVADYEWLARTPATARLATLTVPAGYRRIYAPTATASH